MSEELQTPASDLPSEDEVLAFTHRVRTQAVKDIFGKGTPDDPKMLSLGLAALADMDRVSLGRKRIKVDEASNKTNEQTAALIASMMNKVSSRSGMVLDGSATVVRDIPQLPDHIETPAMVDGETSIEGNLGETYDTFMARMRPEDQ